MGLNTFVSIFLGLLCLSSIKTIKLEEFGPLTKEATIEIDQVFNQIFADSISPIAELLVEQNASEKSCNYCKTAKEVFICIRVKKISC